MSLRSFRIAVTPMLEFTSERRLSKDGSATTQSGGQRLMLPVGCPERDLFSAVVQCARQLPPPPARKTPVPIAGRMSVDRGSFPLFAQLWLLDGCRDAGMFLAFTLRAFGCFGRRRPGSLFPPIQRGVGFRLKPFRFIGDGQPWDGG
jgi:hypothetical protein